MSYGRPTEAFFENGGWGGEGGLGVQSDENCCVGRLRQLCEVIFQECERERGAD